MNLNLIGSKSTFTKFSNIHPTVCWL